MDIRERKKIFSGVKRIVLKVGSGVLTRRSGLNLNLIDDLAADICQLRRRGTEVVLVSSGAIAAGMRKIGLAKRPAGVSAMQALAAMGQSRLIMAYEEAFARYGEKVAQVLLTRDDLTHRRRYLNARNTLFTLLSWKVTPIINENDTVVADEIKFGDNDALSAMVVSLIGADLLVNLTNIDGLYDRDPREHPEARRIAVVGRVDRRIQQYASTIPGVLGTGGMASKVAAARKAALGGVPTVIANGTTTGIIGEIFAGKPVGTLFLPEPTVLSRKKQWIAFTKAIKGTLVVDAGAEKALVERHKSLLPSGIREVAGRFAVGNAVAIHSEDGRRIGIGLVNYSAEQLTRIAGARSSQIEPLLGFRHDDEAIHRDNLVLAEEIDQ
ncbi:MAG: glutamate 5-kinase [Deltaproteobacteria bacterium]|nr:MAG: glutamate 5-kinase [Deltaproteobacteria bacterium]